MVKIAIDMITEWANRNKYGTVPETLQMLKSIQESENLLNLANYPAFT